MAKSMIIIKLDNGLVVILPEPENYTEEAQGIRNVYLKLHEAGDKL